MLFIKVTLIFLLFFTVSLQSKLIKIGTSVALTGQSQALGTNLVRGMNLVFDSINKQGGIKGDLIEFIVLDDQYNPDKTVENTISLLNDHHVDILTSFTGMTTV
tara:strand:+ start:1958 stop:2269 length:312 start_codon:yes stop_codon:yes gene_type:complete